MSIQIKNPLTTIISVEEKSDIDLLDLYANFILTDYNIQQLYNGNYLINEVVQNG